MKEYVQYYSEISTKPTTDYRMFKRYHAFKMKNEYKDELNVITLPFDSAGITIVNRKNDRRLNKWK